MLADWSILGDHALLAASFKQHMHFWGKFTSILKTGSQFWRADALKVPGWANFACSTGWITTWGEAMANTSASLMMQTLTDIVEYANSTGSVNLYMAHGGTNFGYWAGILTFKHLQAKIRKWKAQGIDQRSWFLLHFGVTVTRIFNVGANLKSADPTPDLGGTVHPYQSSIGGLHTLFWQMQQKNTGVLSLSWKGESRSTVPL